MILQMAPSYGRCVRFVRENILQHAIVPVSFSAYGHDPERERACEVEWLAQFGRAIFAIGNMCILLKPDADKSKHTHPYLSERISMVSAFLRRASEPSDLRAGPFIMACLVMGVPVSGWDTYMATPSIGLAEHVGKPADPSAWRSVLRSGKLPAQFRVERVMVAQGSPATVTYF
jgi:hypothetical protein